MVMFLSVFTFPSAQKLNLFISVSEELLDVKLRLRMIFGALEHCQICQFSQ